jgi:hypothetical protein
MKIIHYSIIALIIFAALAVVGQATQNSIQDGLLSLGNFTFNSSGLYYGNVHIADETMQTGDTTYDENGTFRNNVKVSGYYDFGVYDGTNPEVYTQCKVVCDDSDCTGEWYDVLNLKESGTIYIKSGQYNFSTPGTSPSVYSQDGILELNKSHITIQGEPGTIFYFDYPTSHGKSMAALLVYNASDVHIDGINFDADMDCDAARTCNGIVYYDLHNSSFTNNFIANIHGFTTRILSLESRGGNDITFEKNILIGVGNNDVIGAEPMTSAGSLKNLKIRDNTVIQTKIDGTYAGGIELAKVEDSFIEGNTCYGNLGTAPERGASINVHIINNKIYPLSDGTGTLLNVENDSSRDHVIKGNLVEKGYMKILGYSHEIEGNKVVTSTVANNFYGDEHEIINNEFRGESLYQIYIRGNKVQFKLNKVIGGSRAINILGNFTDVSNNHIWNVTFGGGYTTVFDLEYAQYTKAHGNYIYVPPGKTTTTGFLLFDADHNDIQNNVVFNFGTMENLLRFRNSANDTYAVNNIIHNVPASVSKYDVAGITAFNHIDDRDYTTFPNCWTTNNGHRLSNNTHDGVCKSETWKTVAFS